jgi:ADP-ribose pyrophosphatase YjhB (NUDIX family)
MKIRNIAVSVLRGDCAGLPALSGEVNEHTVRRACAEIISEASSRGESSVSVPAVGCAGGFPVVGSAKIVSQEILRAAREGRGSLQQILVCLDNDEYFRIFEKQVFGYLRHVTEDMAWGPYITTDIIIEIGDGIVLIERTNPPFGWALPGGFVDNGEALETAARREAKEETNLELEDLKQFHTYSDPARDPRFHTVTTVFTAKGRGEPRAGDDAKGLKIVPFGQLPGMSFAFDHNRVIADYLQARQIG